MTHTPMKNYRKACVVGLSLCILAIAMTAFLLLGKAGNTDALNEARRVLPGYTIVFDGHTNEIQRCGSLRAFSQQHEMMDYLSIFAPYIEHYNHTTNYPIFIYETDERMIIELPSKYRLPPYNWKVYWGSSYRFKMEIDKKTKKVISALQG